MFGGVCDQRERVLNAEGIKMNPGVLPIGPNDLHIHVYILLVLDSEFMINDGKTSLDVTVGIEIHGLQEKIKLL